MRISRVLIENYRNFRRLEIDPFPPSAVIVGENGVGKSNFLRALRLVLDPDLPDSARFLRPEDICEFSDTTYEKGVKVRVEIDITGFAGNLKAEAALDGCFSELNPLTARLTYLFEPLVKVDGQSPTNLTRDDYTWDIWAGIKADRDGRRIRRDVNFTVLPAMRDAVGDLSRWRDSPLQELLDTRKPNKSALADTAKKVSAAMDLLAQEPDIAQLANDVSKRLIAMAGSRVDISPKLGFASSDPDRLLRSIRLFVDQERTRSVADASTGNANILYLALLLERAASRRESDAVLDTILGVEEPEAHLHPVLQRQVFSYLLRNESSLMVTTHSPHIAAVSRLDSLVLLRPGRDGATEAAFTARCNFTAMQKADLERYLDVSRAEILFCSGAILVEGIAEVYVVPALAKALGFDLDEHGVVVANITGTDFQPFRNLLGSGALQVPHVIITDGDPTNKEGEYIHLGLRRAAKLMEPVKQSDFLRRVEEALAMGDQADTFSLRAEAVDVGVFIGPKTLEVDVAPLLVEPMVSAYADFDVSEPLKAKFEQAARGLAGGDQAHIEEFLRRIDAVSKGRFAQRLASYVENADFSTFSSRMEGVIASVTSSATEEEKERRVVMGLYSHSTFGHLVSALDQISRAVRKTGLFDAKPAKGEA
ncbi:ATP-dependent endonuclease [Streptomyces sp. NPDC055966]|uniref:ATP-dependent nuclease n=1 Tax=Streptomyces sp. NPDC055966 TaxID=3345669 RepID=UPI0035E133C0